MKELLIIGLAILVVYLFMTRSTSNTKVTQRDTKKATTQIGVSTAGHLQSSKTIQTTTKPPVIIMSNNNYSGMGLIVNDEASIGSVLIP